MFVDDRETLLSDDKTKILTFLVRIWMSNSGKDFGEILNDLVDEYSLTNKEVKIPVKLEPSNKLTLVNYFPYIDDRKFANFLESFIEKHTIA